MEQMKDLKFAEEIKKMEYEPLDDTEKKLVGWSLGLGVALLVGIAVWPELDRMEDRARVSFRRVAGTAPDAVRVVSTAYPGPDYVGHMRVHFDTPGGFGFEQAIVDAMLDEYLKLRPL